jgi:single-stranded DNA-binding protein
MIDCAFFGSLVADAERKVSKNGKPYLRFRCAVGSGDDTQFVGVMLFGDCVDELGDATKGTRVYCEGRLKLDKWTGQDGAERYGLGAMCFYARGAQIGDRKPKRESVPDIFGGAGE